MDTDKQHVVIARSMLEEIDRMIRSDDVGSREEFEKLE